MGPTHLLAYQEQNSRQTLREGLAEYYALAPDLMGMEDLRPEAREALIAHDAAHVVFGCDTSVRGEIALTRWSLLGARNALPVYVHGLLWRETRGLFGEFFRKLRPLSFLLGMWDGLRALGRALRMKTRWPSREYARYLDRPLRELRREFNIQVL